MKFWFKHLDQEGQPVGFFSKKGRLEESRLVLKDKLIDLHTIHSAALYEDCMILEIERENGNMFEFMFVVTQGDAFRLRTLLNVSTSRNRILAQKEELKAQGWDVEFRIQDCPHCNGALNLTAFTPTAQCYCTYCEALVTLEGQGPKDESEYRICGCCGYYAKPQDFTIFYFYFLFVIYGWRYGKAYMCGTCMRPTAWKMVAGNALFLIGLPVALWQLAKTYGIEDNKGYPGLDAANIKAKKGKTSQALLGFEEIQSGASQQGSVGSAGICYNQGVALLDHAMTTEQMQDAMAKFQGALNLCSNHYPSFEALASCHQNLGDQEAYEALVSSWGQIELGAQDEPMF